MTDTSNTPEPMPLEEIEIQRVRGTKAFMQLEYLTGKSAQMFQAELWHQGMPFSPAAVEEIQAVGGMVTAQSGYARVAVHMRPPSLESRDMASVANAIPISVVEVAEQTEAGEIKTQRVFTIPQLYTRFGGHQREVFLPFLTWDHVLAFCKNVGLHPVPDTAAQALRRAHL